MVTPETQTFAILRRAVDSSGRLGPEQRVTYATIFDAMRPQATRLPSGEVELTFVVGSRSGAAIVAERLAKVVISGDAPLTSRKRTP